MKKKKRRNLNWGGARDNAGRKSIWNHKETCTMRVPKVFVPKLHEIAQKLDKGTNIEFEIKSKFSQNDLVSSSNVPEKASKLEKATESSAQDIDFVTRTNPDLSQAIDLAKQILQQKKSARISLAQFISKLYNVPVNAENLK
jgi:hypothetical protein